MIMKEVVTVLHSSIQSVVVDGSQLFMVLKVSRIIDFKTTSSHNYYFTYLQCILILLWLFYTDIHLIEMYKSIL